MKKLNIAIPVLSLKYHGGTKILIALANKLSKEYTVTFIVPKGAIDTPYELSSMVKILEINSFVKNKYFSQLFFLFIVIFKLKKYDLTIANFFITYYPTKLANILWQTKFIYFIQDIESKFKGNLSLILNILAEKTYNSRHIVTANDFLNQEIKKRNRIPLLSINIGPDEIFYKLKSLNDKKEYDIIYFARSETWKNLNGFLNFLELSSRKYSILYVSQDENLLNKIQKIGFGHKIICKKPKDVEELIEYIDLSKIMISTSLYEGFSLPPLEAMARKLCVILYPSGGPDLYIIDKENAFYFKQIEELPILINSLLDNKELYNKISENAFTKAKEFQLAQGLNSISKLISTLK